MAHESNETKYACPCGAGVVTMYVASLGPTSDHDIRAPGKIDCSSCSGRYSVRLLRKGLTATEIATNKDVKLTKL